VLDLRQRIKDIIETRSSFGRRLSCPSVYRDSCRVADYRNAAAKVEGKRRKEAEALELAIIHSVLGGGWPGRVPKRRMSTGLSSLWNSKKVSITFSASVYLIIFKVAFIAAKQVSASSAPLQAPSCD